MRCDTNYYLPSVLQGVNGCVLRLKRLDPAHNTRALARTGHRRTRVSGGFRADSHPTQKLTFGGATTLLMKQREPPPGQT